MQVKASYVSFIIFFARIWDGFSDPFVGYLVSKTRLKWGRLRAWCVDGACRHTGTHTRRRTCFSLPVCLLGYFAFWMVPKGLCMSAAVRCALSSDRSGGRAGGVLLRCHCCVPDRICGVFRICLHEHHHCGRPIWCRTRR